MLASQSCLTLCKPMDYSPPGLSVHGILQTRILEWETIPFSRRSNLGLPHCRWILQCPGSSNGKESACNAGDLDLIPGLGKIPWRRARQPTPVFLTGESHGQRSLAGYSSWDCKELDTTEQLSTNLHNIYSSLLTLNIRLLYHSRIKKKKKHLLLFFTVVFPFQKVLNHFHVTALI